MLPTGTLHQPAPQSRNAFTLVELSIVLVIIGLIAGGVVGGQSIIKASQVRAVTTEMNRNKAAINTFRDKYRALPGDFARATSYWTADAGNCTSDAIVAGRTCNGDGDGFVAYIQPEAYRVWNHLALAGLIEGQYNGINGTTPNVNLPASRYPGGSWSFWYLASAWSATVNRHFHVLGHRPDAAAWQWHLPVMKTSEMYNIDVKIDDGKPYQGRMVHPDVVGADCTTTTNYYTAEYKLTYTEIACTPLFDAGF